MPNTEGTAVFLNNLDILGKGAQEVNTRNVDFTVDAVDSSQIVVGLKDYKGTEHVYTFALSGLEGALNRLACYDGKEFRNIASIGAFAVTLDKDAIGAIIKELCPQERQGSLGPEYICETRLKFTLLEVKGGYFISADGTDYSLYHLVKSQFAGHIVEPRAEP